MGDFFTRERFGQPQVLAGFLLLGFLGQCIWLISHDTRPLEVEQTDVFRIEEAFAQFRGQAIAGTPSTDRMETGTAAPPELQSNDGYDPNHSPLWYLVSAAPLWSWYGPAIPASMQVWNWLVRAPYLAFGILLGASVWYVSRRLYGNAGGYIALTLYCFSPATIRSSALWSAQAELGAAWGTFGAIFTAIAVAHTLYAPREVVVWNWRRILLLGLSFALAIGSQFSLLLLLPVAVAFMIYLAPARWQAAVVIWFAAALLGFGLLYASYSFHAGAFAQGIRHADFFPITWPAYHMAGAYEQLLVQIGKSSPPLLLALPVAITTYIAWPRSRYFGNTAPLMVGALFLLLAVGTPHYPGDGFYLMTVPFLLVFVAGIVADLLETPQRPLVAACVWGLLGANALWNLVELARLTGD